MKSYLEKVHDLILNEETDAAKELLHRAIVKISRQIHENMMHEDDEVLDGHFDPEEEIDNIKAEETHGFGLHEEDEDMDDDMLDDAEMEDSDMDAAHDEGEVDADLEDMEGDTDELESDMDDVEADVDGDMDADQDVEDEIEALRADLEALRAEFDELAGEESDEDMDGDVDMDMDSDEGMEDDEDMDMDSEVDGDVSDEVEDDEEGVDGLGESALSDLEKVNNKNTEDLVGSGGQKLSVNKDSILPKKAAKAELADAKELTSKQSMHNGFARETAPSVKSLGRFKNAHNSYDATLKGVSKEGDKSAMLNKGEGFGAEQLVSPISGKKMK